MAQNPFKPTAGKMPPILIGRRPIIDDFVEGIQNGAGAPGRLMLMTGQRGFGKTVMLTELGSVAREHDWDVVSDTASEGLCARLVAALSPRGPRLSRASIAPEVSLAGVASARLGSVELAAGEQGALTLRRAIESRLAKVGDGKGLAFTIDEAQSASLEDMTALATALQHVIRDEDMRDVPDSRKKGVALVFAALPSLMDELLNDRVLTFLRRSMQRELAEVSLPDVRSAYVETVLESGKAISEEDALAAARAACGYPYMIQLIGYYMWQAAERRGSCVIESADVETGISDAVLAFGDAVCAPLLDGLTPAQRAFVQAMAADDPEPSRLSDIAERTRRSMSWANKYRASLIKERVVEPEGRGLLRLTTPHLAEYIRTRRRS